MNYTFRKATAILFSRIVLTQLDNEQRSAFRKAEKLTKQYTKIKSDLRYLFIYVFKYTHMKNTYIIIKYIYIKMTLFL